MAGSVSPGNTTSTCTCAGSSFIDRPTAIRCSSATKWRSSPTDKGQTMTVTIGAPGGLAEDLDAFRTRAKEWVTTNLEPLNGADPYLGHATDDADQVVRAKAIQRKLWDAGFAGLCYPVEYGGRGMPAGNQDGLIAVSPGTRVAARLHPPQLH